MKNVYLLINVLYLALLSLSAVAEVCPPEDCAQESREISTKMLVPIGAMTIPNIEMDFDTLPAGPTSVAAIRAAFPGSTLTNITLNTRAGSGTYNFQAGSGNAIGANPDNSGNLAVIAVNGSFQNMNSVVIQLSQPTTEFGFGIGDWSGPFNVTVFAGANLVSTLQVSTTNGGTAGSPGSSHFIQETTLFDRIELTALPNNPSANWVIHFLAVPALVLPSSVTSIPTLSDWGIWLLVGLFGLVIVLRRHNIMG
jgi:hypothetical protein